MAVDILDSFKVLLAIGASALVLGLVARAARRDWAPAAMLLGIVSMLFAVMGLWVGRT